MMSVEGFTITSARKDKRKKKKPPVRQKQRAGGFL
jgi:hypothetical protein